MKSLFKIVLTVTVLLFPAKGYANASLSVETEALEIADRVRCLVCSDENIETAKDETAKDMRFFIRRHLTDGKGQDMVIHLLLAQYGDMISLEDTPVQTTRNEKIFLFLSFASSLSAMGFYIYRRSRHFKG